MGSVTNVAPFWGDQLIEESVLGAPCRVFLHRRRHLGDLFDDTELHLDATYLVQGARRLTFARHAAAVAAVRRYLHDSGVSRGDPVLILGANSIELVASFWAVVRAGAVAVLGNAWWSADEVAHGLRTVTPKLVIADGRRAALLPAGTPTIRFADIEAVIAAAGVAGDQPATPVDEDDPAVVIFTSGTTGFPKAAVLSHRAVLANLQSLLVVTGRLPGRSSGGRSSVVQILSALVNGTTLVFSEGRFDPVAVTELIDRERVTVWSAVPTMVARVMDHLEAGGRELPGLRTVGMGGSFVSEEIRRRARRLFPNAQRGIGVTYGLTESGGPVTTAAGEAVAARPGCVGRVLPGCEIRIAAPDATGEGEIVVRSPSVMLGYWGGEPDGIDAERWLYTGDLGRLDDEGFLYVTGRQKDIIIRGGENIAATRVEAELLRHPGVAEAAVVGLPHPDLGEEVAAVVVARGEVTLDPVDLTQFVGRSLAYFAVPTAWWIHPGPLPQNATGKILKRELSATWPERQDPSRGGPNA
jgi:long-chain acyl-CoA synthetase